MAVLTGDTEYFRGIGQIKYEGPGSDNPLCFRWYDETRVVGGKTMKDHLRFASAYWHSFGGNGSDPFGEPTHLFPWDQKGDPIEKAKAKMDAAFEFITKMGMPYYCFHDVDVVGYGSDIGENDRRLQALVDYAKQKQQASGVKLLWGTANLFSNKRYMNGAATNPDFHVVAHAGAQVKAALDATIALGGLTLIHTGEEFKTVREEAVPEYADALETVFENGRIVRAQTFEMIREQVAQFNATAVLS